MPQAGTRALLRLADRSLREGRLARLERGRREQLPPWRKRKTGRRCRQMAANRPLFLDASGEHSMVCPSLLRIDRGPL